MQFKGLAHPWLDQCQPRPVSQAKLDNSTQTDIAPWHAQDVGSWMPWNLTYLCLTILFFDSFATVDGQSLANQLICKNIPHHGN